MELFDIVEPDLHWIAGGDVMKASRFSSSASENDALMEEPSKTQLEQADTRGVAKSGIVREIPDKAAVLVGPTRARSCYPLLKAPEHIFGGQQTAEEQTHSKLPAEECRHHTPADYRVSVKDVEAERPPRRVVFDSQDAPPSRRGMPGPNVDFVTGNPLPFYVPYSVHDKTAIFESRFESASNPNWAFRIRIAGQNGCEYIWPHAMVLFLHFKFNDGNNNSIEHCQHV